MKNDLVKKFGKAFQFWKVDIDSYPTINYGETVRSDELGGNVITLNFSYSLNDMLEKANVSRANCMASLCYTLCSFFPAASGVTVTIGEQPVPAGSVQDSSQLARPESKFSGPV